MIKTEYITGKRIVLQKDAENADFILKENPRQAVLAGGLDFTKIKKGGYILVDFGVEMQGGIIYSIQDMGEQDFTGTGSMRVTFGESVMEALSSEGYKNATNEHAIRDTVVTVTRLSTQRIGNTGFRFVKIEAVDCDIWFGCIQAVSEMADLPYIGEFECNDERLNEIWRVGAYTVNVNMQEYIWDGIKRDRLVWIGDMHPEVSTIAAVFGDNEVVRKSLDLVRDYTPVDKWMNTIASYTMWWIIIHRDWYKYTGDKAYLMEQKDYALRAAQRIVNCIDENGNFSKDIDPFVDWSSKEKPEAWVGVRAMTSLSLNAAAEIANWTGEEELAKTFLEARTKLLTHKAEGYEGNKQITAVTALSGFADMETAAKIIEKDGAKGFSTFWGYYSLQALAKGGRMDKAMDIIREYWGAMLDLGATTFWEDFDIEWIKNAAPITDVVPEGKDDIHGDFGKYCYEKFRHSLCHGWASGPTAFMSQYVLGIFPVEPGFKKVKIKPDLGNLKWAKGKFPTPYGTISVEHKLIDDRVFTEVTVPGEIEIIEN